MEGDLFGQMVAHEEEHWWFLGRGALVRSLVEQESARRGGRIPRLVDVGPGTGRLLEHFAAHADEALGVESEAQALELGRGRGLDVREGSADALPLPSASVDVLTAFDVLEHVPDDVAAVREIRRVLRPDGTALVTVPAYGWLWSDHDVWHQHCRRYTRRSLRATLEAGGLQVRRGGYLMGLLLPLAVAQRLAGRLLGSRRSLAPPPRPLNALLLRTLLLERRLVRGRGLPFGLTVFAVATPGGDA